MPDKLKIKSWYLKRCKQKPIQWRIIMKTIPTYTSLSNIYNTVHTTDNFIFILTETDTTLFN